MWAVNASTGVMIWTATIGAGGWGQPALAANGLLYVSGGDTTVRALRQSTGAAVWTFTTGGTIFASPVVTPSGAVVVVSTSGTVHCLAGTTGAQLWAYAAGLGTSYATPAVDYDGDIYAAGKAGVFVALSSTGSLLWSASGLSTAEYEAALVVSNALGLVYAANWDTKVYAVNTGGACQWIIMGRVAQSSF